MDGTTGLLTPEDLARHLCVAPDTVRVWARIGRIPSIRPSRQVIRFDLVAVLAALTAAAAGGRRERPIADSAGGEVSR